MNTFLNVIVVGSVAAFVGYVTPVVEIPSFTFELADLATSWHVAAGLIGLIALFTLNELRK